MHRRAALVRRLRARQRLPVFKILRAYPVGIADDADMLAGDDVNGPFSAYAQAQIIDKKLDGYIERKANRSEMPDNLRPQIPIVMDVMDAFGLCKC